MHLGALRRALPMPIKRALKWLIGWGFVSWRRVRPTTSSARAGDAKVWAFEPSRENYRAAQITTLLNDLPNVVLTNAGLGAERASALLATTDREGTPLGGASRVIKDPARARWWTNEQVELLEL